MQPRQFQERSTMAASIKVFSGNSLRASLDELVPAFERIGGTRVTVVYASAQAVQKSLASGETADLIFTTEELIDSLIKQGTLVPSMRRRLVASEAGIAVKQGAPRPDIRTAETFKQTLLKARAVAYASHGVSGLHFQRVVEKLGIAAEIRAKAKTRSDGLVGDFLLSGEADLCIQHIPELKAVQGVDIVGPFPPGLEFANILVAGVFASSQQRAAAEGFIDFLMTPASTRVLVEHGLKPLY
jgi:molybdate transport system substrate-binding protein